MNGLSSGIGYYVSGCAHRPRALWSGSRRDRAACSTSMLTETSLSAATKQVKAGMKPSRACVCVCMFWYVCVFCVMHAHVHIQQMTGLSVSVYVVVDEFGSVFQSRAGCALWSRPFRVLQPCRACAAALYHHSGCRPAAQLRNEGPLALCLSLVLVSSLLS